MWEAIQIIASYLKFTFVRPISKFSKTMFKAIHLHIFFKFFFILAVRRISFSCLWIALSTLTLPVSNTHLQKSTVDYHFIVTSLWWRRDFSLILTQFILVGCSLFTFLLPEICLQISELLWTKISRKTRSFEKYAKTDFFDLEICCNKYLKIFY